MKAVVDRIEEHIAVLVFPELGEIRLNLPTVLLPDGCSEGDILDLFIRRDDAATEVARQRVSALIRDLVNRGHQ